eukprot:5620956-Prymnesium_polylepis.1
MEMRWPWGRRVALGSERTCCKWASAATSAAPGRQGRERKSDRERVGQSRGGGQGVAHRAHEAHSSNEKQGTSGSGVRPHGYVACCTCWYPFTTIGNVFSTVSSCVQPREGYRIATREGETYCVVCCVGLALG